MRHIKCLNVLILLLFWLCVHTSIRQGLKLVCQTLVLDISILNNRVNDLSVCTVASRHQTAVAELHFLDVWCKVAGCSWASGISYCNGYLCLEHGHRQAHDVRAMAEESGWRSIQTHQDLAGRDRVTRMQKR